MNLLRLKQIFNKEFFQLKDLEEKKNNKPLRTSLQVCGL